MASFSIFLFPFEQQECKSAKYESYMRNITLTIYMPQEKLLDKISFFKPHKKYVYKKLFTSK
jgi:hypothetical protein